MLALSSAHRFLLLSAPFLPIRKTFAAVLALEISHRMPSCIAVAVLSGWAMTLSIGCATPLSLPGLADVAVEKSLDTTPSRAEKAPENEGAVFASDELPPTPASDPARIKTEAVRIAPEDSLGQGPLTLAAVLDYARRNHPQLRSKAQEIDLARAERLGAGLFANPQLVMDADGPVDGNDRATLTTRVDFTLPIGGKRQRGMAAAAAAEERARLELAYETDLVLLEVADAATQVLYFQELAEQQQELSDLNARFSRMQDERAARNVITDVDRLVATTSAKEVEFERLRTLADLEQARLLLAQAMGMITPRPLVLGGHLECPSVPPIPLDTVLNAARQVRPELRAGDWEIREQQRRTALAQAEGIPDLIVSPRYGETFDNDDDRLGARLATDLVFWNWNQGDIAAGLAATRQATANRGLYEATTLGDLSQAYVRLAPIQRQLDYYDQDVAPAMQASIAGIEKAFAVQAVDAAELSQQLNRLAKLKRANLELRFLHQQTRMRIEILLRRPLSSLAAEPIPLGPPAPSPLPSP